MKGNPFDPWNNPMYKGDPFAPWNGMDHDSPFKCWNDPFSRGDEEDKVQEYCQEHNIDWRR